MIWAMGAKCSLMALSTYIFIDSFGFTNFISLTQVTIYIILSKICFPYFVEHNQ